MLRSAPQDNPRICVIGAGPSGLTTIKNLLALGLTNAACFEESDAIGGNWVFREDRPSVHATTSMISSKRLSEFEDYPMPADFPDFPSHRFQPLGCIWRLADHQAHSAALQIAGYLARPADVGARIERDPPTTRSTLTTTIFVRSY
jgi:cation diffusion facilitator CzcD-associated flavoprotein CzcO